MTARFWGRLPIESGTALFHFVKGGLVQHLIHELKYNHKREVGIELGKWLGNQLKESPWYQQIDVIVPVPLHPKKEHKRGYNQSALFAAGMAESDGPTVEKECIDSENRFYISNP